MPAIGAILGSVCAGIAAAVSAVAAALSGVIAGIAGAIKAVVGGIAAVIGSAVFKVASGIYSVVSAITMDMIAPLASGIGDFAGTIATVVSDMSRGLATAINGITLPVRSVYTATVRTLSDIYEGTIDPVIKRVEHILDGRIKLIKVTFEAVDKTATVLLTPIKDSLQWIYNSVQKVGEGIKTAFHPSARMADLIKAHPEAWDRAMGLTDVFLADLQDMAVITATEASLLALPDLFNIVNAVGTLKVLDNLLKGQSSIGEALTAVGQGEAGMIVAAIVELSKGIVTASVELLDYVDSNVGLLRKQIDGLDETLWRNIRERTELTKSEVLAVVTPRMTVLGDRQLKVVRDIARLSRHVEDRAWFAFMLARALP